MVFIMEKNYGFEYMYFELVRKTICYQYFYNKTFTEVEKYVLKNYGTKQDAEELFKATINTFLMKLFNGEYNFMVSDFKYDKVCRLLTSMCKETWNECLLTPK